MRTKDVLLALALGASASLASIAGCGGDDPGDPAPSGGASCAPTDPACSDVSSDCIALADNAGKSTFTLRMSQLTLTKPDQLSEGLVRQIIASGVTMDRQACNLSGDGTFSWLFEFDLDAMTLRTGGAKPVVDPTQGYCYVNETITQGDTSFDIDPLELALTESGGKLSAGGDDFEMVVPIYTDATATKAVLLPLKGVRVFDVVISEDRNCIGKYNASGLDPANNCQPDVDVSQFIDAAKVRGYVVLEEADSVPIELLANRSLCVLLSGSPSTYGDGGTPLRCKRDANAEIVLKGDWCSTSNTPATADCADAFELGAEFAASAVRVNGPCN